MKHFLAVAIALLVIVKAFEVAPLTKAPVELLKQNLQATIIQSSFTAETDLPETKTLLHLLEMAIDQEHDIDKGLEIISNTPSTPGNKKIIDLYEAKILARTLDFEKARELLQLLGDDEEMVLIKAAVLIASGDRNQAGAYLHGIVDQHPDQKVRLTALSLLNIYREFDRNRDADESYLWTLFAQKLGELGEYEISLYLAEKAIERNKEYRDAWIIKGYNELTLKKPDEAELSLLTAYKFDPGNHHIQYLLGLTYFELQKPDLSTQYLLYARQNEAQYQSIIHEKLAENAISTTDFPLAAHYYEELLGMEPEHFQALSRLVWLYTEHLKDAKKGEEKGRLLVQLYPKNAESYKLLGWTLVQQERTDEAAEYLEKAKKYE